MEGSTDSEHSPAKGRSSVRRGSHFGLFSPERSSQVSRLLDDVESETADPDGSIEDMSRPAKVAEQWAGISADAAAAGDVEGARLAAARAEQALKDMSLLAEAAGGSDVRAGSKARTAQSFFAATRPMSYLQNPDDVDRIEAMEAYAERTRHARLEEQRAKEDKQKKSKEIERRWAERRSTARRLERAAVLKRNKEMDEAEAEWKSKQTWLEKKKKAEQEEK